MAETPEEFQAILRDQPEIQEAIDKSNARIEQGQPLGHQPARPTKRFTAEQWAALSPEEWRKNLRESTRRMIAENKRLFDALANEERHDGQGMH